MDKKIITFYAKLFYLTGPFVPVQCAVIQKQPVMRQCDTGVPPGAIIREKNNLYQPYEVRICRGLIDVEQVVVTAIIFRTANLPSGAGFCFTPKALK